MSDVKELERTIELREQEKYNGEVVLKLLNTKAFKEVILDGYVTGNVQSLLERLADGNAVDANVRNQIHREMEGIAMLQRFLNDALEKGKQADSALPGLREELDMARDEEVI